MANRSCLYASEFIPERDAPIAPIGLSEFEWDVPLAHKLMMAGAPERVQSAIWPAKRVGIIADRKGAAERVLAFYDKLLQGEVARRDDLEAQLAVMKAVLSKTPEPPYLLLEVGEIIDGQGGDLEVGVDAVIDEIKELAARVERALSGKEAAWLGTLRNEEREQLELGTWSNVLYFSFPELPREVLAKRRAEAKPRKSARKKGGATTRRQTPKTTPEILGHTRPTPEGTLSLAMRDPRRVKTPVHPYLRDLNDRIVLTSDVRCWHVNEDPPHVLAPAPFDVAVLGEREIYWGAPDRDPPVFEQSFLLHAITGIDVARPHALEHVLSTDAVTVLIRTPSGRTLMVCPNELAIALETAVAKARGQVR